LVIETFWRGTAEMPSMSVPAWMTVSALKEFWAERLRTRAATKRATRVSFKWSNAAVNRAASIAAIISRHGPAFDVECTRGVVGRCSKRRRHRRMLARPAALYDRCGGGHGSLGLAGRTLSFAGGLQGPNDLLLGRHCLSAGGALQQLADQVGPH